ncbi:hypothetical protein [Streptomyces sp. HNA39]|uniref:hypothetical protein n=1 Tax=Streptomyces sp. HNA39 TaxID=2850561 RepID=UPI002010BBA5|nr:hypothetical protein [Streptomyces sp. HNA39]UQA37496.1 hypothetical protein KRR37_30060 [Streptomyces sp. HNA39]
MAGKKSPAHIAKQAERCYELSLAGLSTRAIAEQMGISQAVVVRRMQHYIQNRTHRKADEWRDRQLDDLMNMRARLQKQIESGDEKAINSAVRIWERVSKIGGLDSATLFKVDMEANVSRESDALEVQKMLDGFFGRDATQAEPQVIPHVDITQRRRRVSKPRPVIASVYDPTQPPTPHTPADEFAAEPDATATEFAEDPISEDVEEFPIHRRRKGKPVQNPAAQFLRDSDDD